MNAEPSPGPTAELNGARAAQPEAPPQHEQPSAGEDPVLFWQARATELKAEIRGLVDRLREGSAERDLGDPFKKQLNSLAKAIKGLHPKRPPDDPVQRFKIMRHTQAIHVLLESALMLQKGDCTHQQVLHDCIRFRRRRLQKWLSRAYPAS